MSAAKEVGRWRTCRASRRAWLPSWTCESQKPRLPNDSDGVPFCATPRRGFNRGLRAGRGFAAVPVTLARRWRGRHGTGSAGKSSWLFPIRPAPVSLGRQWRDDHRLRRFVEDQFQAADVAAVDSIAFRPLAVMADLGLARGALPRWHWLSPRKGIATDGATRRPHRGVKSPAFCGRGVLSRVLRCPIARPAERPARWSWRVLATSDARHETRDAERSRTGSVSIEPTGHTLEVIPPFNRLHAPEHRVQILQGTIASGTPQRGRRNLRVLRHGCRSHQGWSATLATAGGVLAHAGDASNPLAASPPRMVQASRRAEGLLDFIVYCLVTIEFAFARERVRWRANGYAHPSDTARRL